MVKAGLCKMGCFPWRVSSQIDWWIPTRKHHYKLLNGAHRKAWETQRGQREGKAYERERQKEIQWLWSKGRVKREEKSWGQGVPYYELRQKFYSGAKITLECAMHSIFTSMNHYHINFWDHQDYQDWRLTVFCPLQWILHCVPLGCISWNLKV